MTVRLVIPVKPLVKAKMRLDAVLSHVQRASLVQAMLDHVLATARQVVPDSQLLRDDNGLNTACQAALAAASACDRLIIIPADLPLLTAADVMALVAVADGKIAIAADRHGTGTNALSLPVLASSDFTFAFGPDSFIAHQAEAARLGLAKIVIASQGLASDVDLAADLPDAAGLVWER